MNAGHLAAIDVTIDDYRLVQTGLVLWHENDMNQP